MPITKDEQFVFKKITMLSLVAQKGLSLPAKEALKLDIPYSVDIDGKTPFDYCKASNNYDCIIEIFKKMQ